MNERDFVFWLNGFLELSGATTLNEQQVQVLGEMLVLPEFTKELTRSTECYQWVC